MAFATAAITRAAHEAGLAAAPTSGGPVDTAVVAAAVEAHWQLPDQAAAAQLALARAAAARPCATCSVPAWQQAAGGMTGGGFAPPANQSSTAALPARAATGRATSGPASSWGRRGRRSGRSAPGRHPSPHGPRCGGTSSRACTACGRPMRCQPPCSFLGRQDNLALRLVGALPLLPRPSCTSIIGRQLGTACTPGACKTQSSRAAGAAGAGKVLGPPPLKVSNKACAPTACWLAVHRSVQLCSARIV